ncbi:hypothetical protein NIES4075_23500 [Tolypothrix sp. NIES-4075]|nr:hypothetical protein NIES4075_23500 [Tolypothrix sp. NIES-4075]
MGAGVVGVGAGVVGLGLGLRLLIGLGLVVGFFVGVAGLVVGDGVGVCAWVTEVNPTGITSAVPKNSATNLTNLLIFTFKESFKGLYQYGITGL